MKKVTLGTFKEHSTAKNGILVAIDDFQVPMTIKRIFYIYGFEEKRFSEFRGNHGHRNTTQLLIMVHGTGTIILNHHDTFVLDKPNQFLVIPPENYIQMTKFSKDAVLLVACDQNFKDDQVYEEA